VTADETSSPFSKLLGIAERQKHVIEQWRRAQALGPTDDQLWKAELQKIAADFHGLVLKGVTVDQLQEFSEALAFKVKAKQTDR
jgi:hypothetical protein